MNAIGLYYSAEQQSLKEKQVNKLEDNSQIVDLHINIWKVERGSIHLKSEVYIDFGIMVSFKVNKLSLYLPFRVERPEDLGKRLNNKKKELCAIFNDELLPEPQKNGCYCKVKYENDETFYLYELGEDNIDFKLIKDKEKENSYINLTLKGNPDGTEDVTKYQEDKRYIRFRVKVTNRKSISITSHISNDLLQAAFSMSDYYDIRVNERREIPDKVKEYMQNEKFNICHFNKVHLFYMADSREKIENESSLKCDSRLLESCQWKDYEPKTDIYNPIFIAHHWKKRCKKDGDDTDKKNVPFNSFSVFFSTIYPRLNWARLCSYIFVVILLGWCGSMLSFNCSDLKISFSDILCLGIVVLMVLFIFMHSVITNFTIKPFKIFRKK